MEAISRNEFFDKFFAVDKLIRKNIINLAGLYCSDAGLKDSKEQKTSVFNDDIIRILIPVLENYSHLNNRVNNLFPNVPTKESGGYILLSYVDLDFTKCTPENFEKLKVIFKEKDKINKRLEKEVIKLHKENRKFKNPKEKNETCIQIFMRHLKTVNKIPTYESLQVASDNRISKSSWARHLNTSTFLSALLDEIGKLINRTKDNNKAEFYRSVYLKLDNTFTKIQTEKLVLKINNKKLKSKHSEGENIEMLDHVLALKAKEDFESENSYNTED